MRYLLCFLPPLAVLSCKKPFMFLLSCVLTLFGYIPGVIHAFAIVASYQADQRTNRIIKAMRR